MSVFDNGLAWSLYKRMEADFLNYLDYVPYAPGNEDTYSVRLLAMLLQTCAYIDGVFKAMAHYNKFESDRDCQEIRKREAEHGRSDIKLYRKAFEKLYRLSSNNRAEIVARVGWQLPQEEHRLHPFQRFADFEEKGGTPDWWKEYQDIKHEWHNSIKEASMENVLNALGGAFLLNAVHIPSLKVLTETGILKSYIMAGERIIQDDIRVTEPFYRQIISDAENAAIKSEPVFMNWHLLIETPLFTYLHPREDVRKR